MLCTLPLVAAALMFACNQNANAVDVGVGVSIGVGNHHYHQPRSGYIYRTTDSGYSTWYPAETTYNYGPYYSNGYYDNGYYNNGYYNDGYYSNGYSSNYYGSTAYPYNYRIVTPRSDTYTRWYGSGRQRTQHR